MNKKAKIALILIAGILGCWWGVRTYNYYRHHLEKQTRFMMDTYVSIYAIGPKKIASPAVTAALDRMQEIDKKMIRDAIFGEKSEEETKTETSSPEIPQNYSATFEVAPEQQVASAGSDQQDRSDRELGFIKETLITFKQFYSSHVNDGWIKKRYSQWFNHLAGPLAFFQFCSSKRIH